MIDAGEGVIGRPAVDKDAADVAVNFGSGVEAAAVAREEYVKVAVVVIVTPGHAAAIDARESVIGCPTVDQDAAVVAVDLGHYATGSSVRCSR